MAYPPLSLQSGVGLWTITPLPWGDGETNRQAHSIHPRLHGFWLSGLLWSVQWWQFQAPFERWHHHGLTDRGIYTAVRESIGSFSIRGEVESTFGMDALRVSDVTYTPNDGASGKISFGWQSDGLGDVSGSADVTIGKIGDSDREELRLNNTWERVF